MDVGISWSTERAVGDWAFAVGDLATASSIESAVLVSLFTDRIAAPDFKPTDGTTDRRGWWGDSFNDRPIGSRLWQLDRSKKVGQAPLLLQARDYCKESLQWLIDDGIAKTVDVQTQWLSLTALGIVVTITEPTGTVQTPFRYSYAWS